jgi:hypothetical protein
MFNRIYHPYWNWECYKNGMWRKIHKNEEPGMIENAKVFTGNCLLYGSFMIIALNQYPVSCEQFLSNPSINRRAWIGHAAANIAIKSPEYITRIAWGLLSQEQRDLANNQADIAVFKWEKQQSEKVQLCLEIQ